MGPEQQSAWIRHADQVIAQQEGSLKRKEGDYAKTESAMTSRHDHLREDIAGELNTGYKQLAQQRKFRAELESAGPCSTVTSGAVVDLTFDGEEEKYLFMETMSRLPDVQVLTPQSPLGQAIQGKSPDDVASYTVGENTFNIKIKAVS